MSKLPGTIFINYRKDDSRWNALALYNELQKYFDKEQIFKDFNTILPGDDFVYSIENALNKCDVLLVIIGKTWLDIADDKGRRRLEDPDDFVRLEVSTALSRNIQVIPVLFDNVSMPRADDLPENMRMLYRRQFVQIDNTRFEDDVRNLAEAINKVLPGGKLPIEPEIDDHFKGKDDEKRKEKKKPSQPKPSNNLVIAIVATILCLPIGIVGVLAANKVDTLWANEQYNEAISEAQKAKNWSIYAFIVVAILYIFYAIALTGVNM
jgi:Interferon-induced transmembrane protein/TIR domain